jgi:hypothetical protein
MLAGVAVMGAAGEPVSGFSSEKAKMLDGQSVYFGNLHSHTAYSDGTGTPAQAFAWARDSAKLNFYAVTDHAEQVSGAEWQDNCAQARQFDSKGHFAALSGFEWSGGVGHINVLNTNGYTGSNSTRSLEALYSWLQVNGGYGQFNHPAASAGTFNEFAPTGNAAARRMRLVETGNSGAGNNTGFFYDYFIKALDKGWTVAPTSNQDNHSLQTNCHRTGVVSRELSRSGVLEAVSKRRVYSSDDPDMQVLFKHGATWMGSGVSMAKGKTYFDVLVDDNEDIARLDLITNGGKVVATQAFANDHHVQKMIWKPEVDFESSWAYYFVRVVERDDRDEDESHRGNQCTLTAPIWLSVPRHDISMHVQSDKEIIAERPMYFSYKAALPGGSTETGVPKPGKTWYLAEGSTWSGAEEWICIQNPGDTDAHVTISYMFQYGVTRRQGVLVRPHSRYTVDVKLFAGPDKDVSARLVSDQPVVVERPMYFNYNGLGGGSIGAAVSSLSKRWYLAEGATHKGFIEWIALMNPNASPTRAHITYVFPGGATSTQNVNLAAHSRKTVLVNDFVGPNRDVSAIVESDLPIVAERPMYFDYHGVWKGGSSQTGAVSPGTLWCFAEGTTMRNQAAGYFDEWLSILNPGNEDSLFTVTYMFDNGTVKKVGGYVGAHSRRTIDVNSVVGNDRNVSVRVESSKPLVVERPMYYKYHNAFDGGDVEMGTRGGSKDWYFAEGTNREGFEEWLTLMNPQRTEATTQVVLMLEDGTTRDFTYVLPPQSRTTITVNGLMEL